MSDVRVHCPCGNRLFGGDDAIPQLSHVIPDADWPAAFQLYAAKVRAFVLAANTGQRREWLFTEFGVSAVPDLSDDEVFENLLEKVVGPHTRELWRCDACDRVFVEVGPDWFTYDRWLPDREP